MKTIEEALRAVDDAPEADIQQIITALNNPGFGFNCAVENAGRLFRRLDASTVPGLNFKQKLILQEAQEQQAPGGADNSRAQALLLLPSQPLESLPMGAARVRDYLCCWDGMRIPVTPHNCDRVCLIDKVLAQRLECADSSILPSSMAVLLHYPPSDFSSEQTTSFAIGGFLDKVFTCLNSHTDKKLVYDMKLNKVEKGASSSAIRARTRPDTVIVASNCTLLIGEDKVKSAMPEALGDVKRRVVNLSALRYGGVPYILAYTASGTHVQFHIVTMGSSSQQLQVASVSELIDMRQEEGRVRLVLVLVKVYCLLTRMAAVVPDLGGRLPLFVPTTTRSGSTVEFRGDNTVLKEVKHFKVVAAENLTSFEEVCMAHAVATRAASEAVQQQLPPWLVSSASKPYLSSRGTYHVQAGPLGYSTQPANEDELRGAGLACCRAAASLHGATPPLVHRDFRRPNLVRLPNGSWMVLDLEQAAYANKLLPSHYRPGSWREDALDKASEGGQAVYTERSDMYHVGVLLQDFTQSIGAVSPCATEFIAGLLAKQLTAQQALAHPWLQ